MGLAILAGASEIVGGLRYPPERSNLVGDGGKNL